VDYSETSKYSRPRLSIGRAPA